jgi:hypothetical protein
MELRAGAARGGASYRAVGQAQRGRITTRSGSWSASAGHGAGGRWRWARPGSRGVRLASRLDWGGLLPPAPGLVEPVGVSPGLIDGLPLAQHG